MTPRSYYTPAQVAEILQVHPATVRELAAKGQIPGAFKVGEKLWRFDPAAIHRLPGGAGLDTPEEPAGEDDQRRIWASLALAEELDPLVEAGTRGPVDATAAIHAVRAARGRAVNGE
jgi:excisionase family DNA binding protein